MESKKLYSNLRAMPKTMRPINSVAEQVGCHLNTVRNVLKLGKASPLYGAEIVLAASMIWDNWVKQQLETQTAIAKAAEQTRAAAKKAIRQLAA